VAVYVVPPARRFAGVSTAVLEVGSYVTVAAAGDPTGAATVNEEEVIVVASMERENVTVTGSVRPT
jgi:hypothetical protein